VATTGFITVGNNHLKQVSPDCRKFSNCKVEIPNILQTTAIGTPSVVIFSACVIFSLSDNSAFFGHENQSKLILVLV